MKPAEQLEIVNVIAEQKKLDVNGMSIKIQNVSAEVVDANGVTQLSKWT